MDYQRNGRREGNGDSWWTEHNRREEEITTIKRGPVARSDSLLRP